MEPRQKRTLVVLSKDSGIVSGGCYRALRNARQRSSAAGGSNGKSGFRGCSYRASAGLRQHLDLGLLPSLALRRCSSSSFEGSGGRFPRWQDLVAGGKMHCSAGV